ncbi:Putative ripening-related protein 2 [Glycine soja]|nr:Putative ripening-related protein 2 [Glycine soja]
MYKTETSHTKAYLTLNSFEKNGDGGGPSDCDNQYHSDNMPCDSTKGCDADHDYQPPCANNIVDASKAVWEALV